MSLVSEDLKLRHLFISMLFALVVGELALASFIVFDEIEFTQDWLVINKDRIAHLMVCLILITTSWVGWSNTFKDTNYPKLDSLWSRGYVLLLIDIVILIIYFGIVKNLDAIKVSSARAEVLGIGYVFILYVIWDLVYSSKKAPVRIIELLPSGLMCLFCFMVYFMALEKYPVWFVDLLLIGILLIFRVIKESQIRITNQVDH